MASIGDQRWYFSQVKGAPEEDSVDADVIACIEFNRDGELLATGDKGGRVVVFQRDHAPKNNPGKLAEYNVYTTFQSHEPEFDYLKSVEIEEKINKIQWLQHSNPSHFLLSTNDKTIKLWKVSEKRRRPSGELNLRDENGDMRDPTSLTSLRIPHLRDIDEASVGSTPRKVFANAHTYHINSISINSDQETFISADDLRINLWHLSVTNQSFNIVDIKPANMEELTEVITAASFHPTECNTLIYGSSRGTLRLSDLRCQALCDQHVRLYEEPEDEKSKSFFSEIIASVSDVKFSRDGRYLVTRDYLTVKVWDIRKETRPVETYQVHEYLRGKMCMLYENDCIFDKFEACWSPDNNYLLTGSYHNFFHVFDRGNNKNLTFEASRDVQRALQQNGQDLDLDQKPPEKRLPLQEHSVSPPLQANFSALRPIPLEPKRVFLPAGQPTKRKRNEVPLDSLDFSKKILHSAWHPKESTIAIAATNSLYIYSAN